MGWRANPLTRWTNSFLTHLWAGQNGRAKTSCRLKTPTPGPHFLVGWAGWLNCHPYPSPISQSKPIQIPPRKLNFWRGAITTEGPAKQWPSGIPVNQLKRQGHARTSESRLQNTPHTHSLSLSLSHFISEAPFSNHASFIALYCIFQNTSFGVRVFSILPQWRE